MSKIHVDPFALVRGAVDVIEGIAKAAGKRSEGGRKITDAERTAIIEKAKEDFGAVVAEVISDL